MAEYRAHVDWALEPGGDFAKGRYSRAHEIRFDSTQLPYLSGEFVKVFLH